MGMEHWKTPKIPQLLTDLRVSRPFIVKEVTDDGAISVAREDALPWGTGAKVKFSISQLLAQLNLNAVGLTIVQSMISNWFLTPRLIGHTKAKLFCSLATNYIVMMFYNMSVWLIQICFFFCFFLNMYKCKIHLDFLTDCFEQQSKLTKLPPY